MYKSIHSEYTYLLISRTCKNNLSIYDNFYRVVKFFEVCAVVEIKQTLLNNDNLHTECNRSYTNEPLPCKPANMVYLNE